MNLGPGAPGARPSRRRVPPEARPSRRGRFAAGAAVGFAAAFFAAGDGRAAGPAPKPTPLYVLTLRTDDADDQADALTLALRARVRSTAGWTLMETRQSFETLSIALRCPTPPDATCLMRIADHLHADHFVWGSVARLRAGRVAVELHLWNRGHPSTEVDETYSDSLNDPTTKAMRDQASSLFAKLTDPRFAVDDAAQMPLPESATTPSNPPGSAEAPAAAAAPTIPEASPYDVRPWENGPIESGGDTGERPARRPTRPANADRGEGVRVATALGYTAIAAGAGLLLASGVEIAGWANDKTASDADLQKVPRSVSNVCATPTSAAAQDACERSKDATTTSALAWVFGVTGAALATAGIVVVITDSTHPAGEHANAPTHARIEVSPAVDARTRGVNLRVTF